MTFTSAQLRKAAQLKDQIDSLQNRLNAILGSSPAAPSKGGMSAAARAKIAAAQKARWAKQKSSVKPAKEPAKTAPAKPAQKRTMSAAAKAKLAALAKARWAKVKAAGKKQL